VPTHTFRSIKNTIKRLHIQPSATGFNVVRNIGVTVMSQIKLNLDDVVKPLLDHEWPQDCLCLAERYADFPITENIPTLVPDDVLPIGLETALS
jgi:hypothetical protein